MKITLTDTERWAIDSAMRAGVGFLAVEALISDRLSEVAAERDTLRHLLGSHADGHLCTCEMTRPGSHIEPPEWEQDPWCMTHPDMNFITQEHARLRAQVAAMQTRWEDAP